MNMARAQSTSVLIHGDSFLCIFCVWAARIQICTFLDLTDTYTYFKTNICFKCILKTEVENKEKGKNEGKMKASFPSESHLSIAGFTQKQNALEKDHNKMHRLFQQVKLRSI